VFRTGYFARNLAATACAWALLLPPAGAVGPAAPAEPKAGVPQDAVSKQATPNGIVGQLTVTVGKSLTIDSPLAIRRLATANGSLVDAQAISPKEILLNGKAPGETSLIIWQDDGTRLIYDLTVRVSPQRLNAVREQIARDYPDADINVTFDNDTAFVRGTVADVTAADRIMAIVSTLSKAVNLLKVQVPAVEPQILLKVRFVNVDRSASRQLGVNFASGAFNMQSAIGTGPAISTAGAVAASTGGSIFNIFALRPDINLLTEITALENKNLLETLAEPNLLTFSGTRATFTAGGQFPYLTPQPSATGVTFTVSFKDYGVLLSFLPRVTPQGTIHMQVSPEVSALDYTNTVTIQGTAVPGLTVRKVTTEVDLESGQTFVIAGLLDKQITDSFSKIPGLGDIPILGKLFQSKTITKNNSELMIIITPEIVRPIPAQQPVPELKWTVPFMTDNSPIPIRQPGLDSTGPVPVHPPAPSLPLEQLLQQQRLIEPAPIVAPPIAAPPIAAPPIAAPGGAPAAAPASPAGGGGGGGAAGGAGNGN
jgi:pilus assembly protein CpaC